jgi:hypothetical protein
MDIGFRGRAMMTKLRMQWASAWRPWLLLSLAIAACSAPTFLCAHNVGTTGYATVTIDGRTARYAMTLPADVLPPSEDLAQGIIRHVSVEADGVPCAGVVDGTQPVSVKSMNVSAVVLYACAAVIGKLRVRDGMDTLLGPNHHTIADFQWAGGAAQVVFEAGHRDAEIAIGQAKTADREGKGAMRTFVAYLHEGIEHILLGYDHLLFVVALILPGGTIVSLLAVITAFTVAHSITLAVSVLGIFSLPGWIVEPVIALSIAYVAFENLYTRKALSRRWGVSFLFGLVHGFGFAGALAEVGLPTGSVASALIGFNLGVEVGQALVVAIALPLLMGIRKFSWHPRAVQWASVVIMMIAIGLITERTLLG